MFDAKELFSVSNRPSASEELTGTTKFKFTNWNFCSREKMSEKIVDSVVKYSDLGECIVDKESYL